MSAYKADAALKPCIGVLALQGDVQEHVAVLRAIGCEPLRVRRPEELEQVDALIIPGGESTTVDKLSRIFGMREPIRARIAAGMPVLGTCTGLIMLADRLADGGPGQQTFGGLDITVRRNAFGAQVDSFETDLPVPELGNPPAHVAFIRAPVVADVGPQATTLASLPDGQVVAVRQGALTGLSFHPETTGETRFHQDLVAQAAAHMTGRHA